MPIQELLTKSGLDETETKVYLALLQLGPSTVSEITKKAAITRTLGYHILQKLGVYGLVDESASAGARRVFTAEHPQRLLQFVKNKKNAWERKLKDMEDGLPELISMFKVAEKPTIRYQQGIEGVKRIFDETLESKTEILSILDAEGWAQTEFKSWGENYNRERGKRKIHEKFLLLDTPAGREWIKNYKGSFKYTEYRWIKREQLPGIEEFGGEINIYENKVVMALHKPTEMGVVIESRSLANLLKGLHALAWQVGLSAGGKHDKQRRI